MKRKRVQAFTAKRAPERAATAAARRSVGGDEAAVPPKNRGKNEDASFDLSKL
jgi:hypothetical protein